MELLQKALTEALNRNSTEHARWTQYLQDHQQATESLEHFRKSINVDIMVPVGSKALLPGKLYHTNEILLSHSSQMYSKCTSHQAQQVCLHRIDVAKQRLEDLRTERDLYQNKLDLPVAQEAFVASGEREIIEEYNEEAEKRWRDEHHIKMRRHKQAEREAREKSLAANDVNVNELLEELELMEELDFELEHLEIDSDEKLQKLISGEIPLPSVKQRRAHDSTNVPLFKESSPAVVDTIAPLGLDDNANQELSSDDEPSDSDDSSSDEDLPDEFKAYRLEAEDMSTVERLDFYRKKLHYVQERLSTLKATTFDDFVRKTDQMFLCDHLQSEIDRLQVVSTNIDEITKNDLKRSTKSISTNALHRSVSFGENEVTSFDKHQAPLMVSEDIKNKLNASETVDGDYHPNEKERALEYVQKVASMNVDEVKTAMNARHKEVQMKLKAETESKSILKNKEAVQREKRTPSETATSGEPDAQKPLEEFNQIMGEIFEKIYPKSETSGETTEASVVDAVKSNVPDPIPIGLIRDMHAPKARVSRFKASREKQ